MLWEPLQCLLYKQFRFRAWDQYGRRDLERESEKFAFADDIGDRLAIFSALDVGAELLFFGIGQDPLGMGGEVGAIGLTFQ